MAVPKRLSHGNCLFGIIYLVLRGKATEIVGVSTSIPWWPIHFMCLNKRGQLLHFQKGWSYEAQEFAPVFFPGRYCGMSRTRQEEMLKESGRTVKFRTQRVGRCLALMLLLYALLIVPFAIFCVCTFPLIAYGNAKWAVRALRSRS
jgi:hypothetical protein